MAQNRSGAYIVTRGRRGGPRRYRGAAILILCLIVLSAGIVLLVMFMPRLTAERASSTSFGGKTFYFLATAETEKRQVALEYAQDAANRGGAGAIYNDGKYKIIAAAYATEAEANSLVALNEGAFCVSVSIDGAEKANDAKALECLCSDWFPKVYAASADLDRGAATEAAAERAVRDAFLELRACAVNADSELLREAIVSSCDYDIGESGARSVLSYIRYVTVRTIIAASEIGNR